MLTITPYSRSKPLSSNFNVRLFSVTMRITLSGAPSGISASISMVILTFAPNSPDRWAITSSAIVLASRPSLVGFSLTDPW